MPTRHRTPAATWKRQVDELTRELREAREYQAATGAVLKIIGQSSFDYQSLAQTVVENATRLCKADFGHIYEFDGQYYRLSATHGHSPAFRDLLMRSLVSPGRGTLVGRVSLERATVHIPDVLADPEYQWSDAQKLGSYRTMLGVPMLHGDVPIGVIVALRQAVRPFTEQQIEVLTTFAAQGVIAINNVRILSELRNRGRDLARSVDELQALGEVGQAVSSTLELSQVLQTIVTYATQLAETNAGSIYEFDEATQEFRLQAAHGLDPDVIDTISVTRLRLRETLVGRAALQRAPLAVPDLLDESSDPLTTAMIAAGYRAALAVPILHEDRIIGGLVVRRTAPGPFRAETVRLLQTFATQSALAIHNARFYQEIEAKNRQLEIVSRHKSEFLANMSHELRTPLNAIIGFSEVLIDRIFGELNTKQADYLEDILASGRELLALINEILDLAKVEAGRMELEPAVFSLPAALEQSLTLVREQASRHAITLSLEVAPELELVEADELKIKRVIVNLLSNAVKFTPDSGSVTVVARNAGEDVQVAVQDTGPGISPADQERIFEEFQQVGQSALQQHEGTGLGLALAKKLVELHGGRIWVESAPGAGSTFTVTLPLRQRAIAVELPAVSRAVPPTATADRNGPLILLVEDNPQSIELLTLYLGSAGFQVAVARDGEDGLGQVARLRPAAILLDILLPGLDGWEFLNRVKADAALIDIPVIIVSMVDEPGKGYALGAAKYLTKPVNRYELLATLRHVTAAAHTVGHPPRVLAIDDDPIAIELIEAVLQPEGYTVIKAMSGEAGIALAQDEHPSVVILDLLMPGLDGFAVVDRLRATSTTANTPIVILTSKTLNAEEQERLKGRIAFLARKAEFSRAAFVELVRGLCRTDAAD